MMQLARTAGAFFWHDLREDLARPEAVAARLASTVTVLLLIAFGARAYGGSEDAPWAAAGLFAWATVGYAGLGLLWVTLASFRVRVARYRATGLLEACAMTRTPLWKTLFVVPGYDVTAACLGAVAMAALAVAVSPVGWSGRGAVEAAGYLALGLVPMTAVGIVVTGVMLSSRWGSLAERGMRLMSAVACGAVVPREVLPGWLAQVGAWLPLGAMLDGVRAALFGEGGVDAGPSPGVRLMIVAALMAPLAVVAAREAIARALRGGLLVPHPDARIRGF